MVVRQGPGGVTLGNSTGIGNVLHDVSPGETWRFSGRPDFRAEATSRAKVSSARRRNRNVPSRLGGMRRPAKCERSHLCAGSREDRLSPQGETFMGCSGAVENGACRPSADLTGVSPERSSCFGRARARIEALPETPRGAAHNPPRARSGRAPGPVRTTSGTRDDRPRRACGGRRRRPRGAHPDGAPGRARTCTEPGLSRSPLPVGLRGPAAHPASAAGPRGPLRPPGAPAGPPPRSPPRSSATPPPGRLPAGRADDRGRRRHAGRRARGSSRA